jgi:two-component system phosphate regulon sensor histidine kinase PhoR
VPGYSEVYAGFSWDSKEALNRLRSILTEESIGDMELRISGVHGGLAADIMSPVQVYDSFNPSPSLSYRVERDDDIGGALSRAYLPAPLSDVEIAAFLVGEQDIRAAEALESNLIRWGVFLLAVVIMAGSAVIIFKTVGQVAAARQRSEFVVSMSHDLRTPVAAMRVLADSLCAGRVSDPVKQKEFVCSIASECERLGDMIERILFFFRQERGAVSYEMQELDVVSLTEEVVRTVEARFQGGLKVDFGVDDAVPMVRGDAVSLSKVITNLLDNAVKYGRPEGVSQSEAVEVVVRISKGVWRGRKCAVVKVSDRGCGIAEREHRRIFRRFYRVARDQHRHVGGIGLGLSLCMDIVRAHRGKIVVESEPGKGAEFSVWLRGSRKV